MHPCGSRAAYTAEIFPLRPGTAKKLAVKDCPMLGSESPRRRAAWLPWLLRPPLWVTLGELVAPFSQRLQQVLYRYQDASLHSLRWCKMLRRQHDMYSSSFRDFFLSSKGMAFYWTFSHQSQRQNRTSFCRRDPFPSRPSAMYDGALPLLQMSAPLSPRVILHAKKAASNHFYDINICLINCKK